MKIVEIVFAVWSLLVLTWWATTVPESAPQQAALAGQAMVLLFGPYAIVATMQRRHLRNAKDG